MNRLETISALAESSAVMQEQESFVQPANIPPVEIVEGRYVVRFARTREEIDAALKLRFEVFNLELGEGLAESGDGLGRALQESAAIADHRHGVAQDKSAGRTASADLRSGLPRRRRVARSAQGEIVNAKAASLTSQAPWGDTNLVANHHPPRPRVRI